MHHCGHRHNLQGSAKVYAEECAASPCFAINFTQPSSRRTSYEEFRKLNSKWQHKLGKVSCRGTLYGHMLMLDAAQLLGLFCCELAPITVHFAH